MRININRTGPQNILDLINYTNDNRYRERDLVFGVPAMIEGVSPESADMHNTRITVTSTNESLYRVNTELTYRRLNLALQWSRLSLPRSIQVEDKIDLVNDADAVKESVLETVATTMSLRRDNVVIELGEAGSTKTATIRPIEGSYLYIGALTLELEEPTDASTTTDTKVEVTKPLVTLLETGDVSASPNSQEPSQYIVRYINLDNTPKSIRVFRNTVDDGKGGSMNEWTMTGDTVNATAIRGVVLNQETGDIVIPKEFIKAGTEVAAISYIDSTASERATVTVTEDTATQPVYTPQEASSATFAIADNLVKIIPGENNGKVIVSFEDENDISAELTFVKTTDGTWTANANSVNAAQHYGVKVDETFGTIEIPLAKFLPSSTVSVQSFTSNPADTVKDSTVSIPAVTKPVDNTGGQDAGDNSDTGNGDTGQDTGSTDGSGNTDNGDQDNGNGDASETTDGGTDDKGEDNGEDQGQDDTQTGDDTSDGSDDQTQETPPPAKPKEVTSTAATLEFIDGELHITVTPDTQTVSGVIGITWDSVKDTSHYDGIIQEGNMIEVSIDMTRTETGWDIKEPNPSTNVRTSGDKIVVPTNVDISKAITTASYGTEIVTTAKTDPDQTTEPATAQADQSVEVPESRFDFSDKIETAADDTNVTVTLAPTPYVRTYSVSYTPKGGQETTMSVGWNAPNSIIADASHVAVVSSADDGKAVVTLPITKLEPGTQVTVQTNSPHIPSMEGRSTTRTQDVPVSQQVEIDEVTWQLTETSTGQQMVVFTKGANTESFELTFKDRTGNTQTYTCKEDVAGGTLSLRHEGVDLNMGEGNDLVAVSGRTGKIALLTKAIELTDSGNNIRLSSRLGDATRIQTARIEPLPKIDTSDVLSVYDGVYLTVGPFSDPDAVVIKGVQGRIELFKSANGSYVNRNGEELVDTDLVRYTKSETQTTVRIHGRHFLRDDGSYQAAEIYANNDDLSALNKLPYLDLWYNISSVTVDIPGVTLKNSVTPVMTLTDEGKAANIEIPATAQDITVTVTNAVARAERLHYTRMGDTFVANDNNSNRISGQLTGETLKVSFGNEEFPVHIEVTSYDGDPMAYNPATASLVAAGSSTQPVKPIKAANVEIGQYANSVWIKVNQPASRVEVTAGERTWTLSEDTAWMTDDVVSIDDNVITFAAGTFEPETLIMVIAYTANPHDESSDTIAYTTDYIKKPIPSATLQVERGDLIVRRNGAHGLVVEYIGQDDNETNKLVIGQNTIESQINASGVNKDVSGVTVINGDVRIPHNMIADGTIAKAHTRNAEGRDGENTVSTTVSGFDVRVASKPAVEMLEDYNVQVTAQEDHTKLFIEYQRKTALGNNVTGVTFTKGDDGWVTTSSSNEFKIVGSHITFAKEYLVTGENFKATGYLSHPDDTPSSTTIVVIPEPVKPLPLTAINFATNSDNNIVATVDTETVARGTIQYPFYIEGGDDIVPGSMPETITFTVNEAKEIVVGQKPANYDKVVTQTGNTFTFTTAKLMEDEEVTASVTSKDNQTTKESSFTVPAYQPKTLAQPRFTVVDAKTVVSGFDAGLATYTVEFDGYGEHRYVKGAKHTVKVDFVKLAAGSENFLTVPEAISPMVEYNKLTNELKIDNALGYIPTVITGTGTPKDARDSIAPSTFNVPHTPIPDLSEPTITDNPEAGTVDIVFSDINFVDNVTVVFTNKETSEEDSAFIKRTGHNPIAFTAETGNITYVDGVFKLNRDALKFDQTSRTDKNKYSEITVMVGHLVAGKDDISTVKMLTEKGTQEAYPTPDAPVITANAEAKTITITPVANDVSSKALVAAMTLKDGQAVTVKTQMDDNVWSVKSGREYLKEDIATNGTITIDNTILQDASVLFVRVHNNIAGDNYRFNSAEHKVVNKETPAIATTEVEATPKPPVVDLFKPGYFTVTPVADDANTKMLELTFFRDATPEAIEEHVTVTRGDGVWILREPVTGVEFTAETGMLKVMNATVSPDIDIVRATTTNVKVESVVTFKPAMMAPVLESVDGAVTITPPRDTVTQDMIFSWIDDKDNSTRTLSATKESGKWKLMGNPIGVSMNEEGVITLAPRTAKPTTHLVADIYTASGGMRAGPFSVVVTQYKPNPQELVFDQQGTRLDIKPKSGDDELTKYVLKWEDEDGNKETVTNTKADGAWNGTASAGAQVNVNGQGVTTVEPITTEIKNESLVEITLTNTQGSDYTYYRKVIKQDGNIELVDVPAINPADMSSNRGDLTVTPTDPKANKMTVEFFAPTN